MIAFYFDENMNWHVVKALRSRGINVITADEGAHRQTDDSILLNRALQLNRMMVSRDQDMITEVSHRLATGEVCPGLAYITRDLPVRKVTDDLDLIANILEPMEALGMVFYLPL